MLRRWLCFLVLLLMPYLGSAQIGHVNDADAVLYAYAGDIFAVDPTSGVAVNLTEGRIAMEDGWNQPWEPVGNQYKIVFRQFRGSGENFETRIFVLEAIGNTSEIHQIPEIFGRISYFSWSNDNESFAFVTRHTDGTSYAEVIIIESEIVKARIPTPFSSCYSRWSPDGKWIAVISFDEGLLLISTEDYSQTLIPLPGRTTQRMAWGPDSRRLALVLDTVLSIIDLEGNVLQTFGEASSVNDWSADGKYISYETRSPSWPYSRQLHILYLGGVNEAVSGYEDETEGVWSPDSTTLALWAHDSGDDWIYLLVVGPDGNNPIALGYSWGCMAPSWFKLPRGMLMAETE